MKLEKEADILKAVNKLEDEANIPEAVSKPWETYVPEGDNSFVDGFKLYDSIVPKLRGLRKAGLKTKKNS